jgi:4'-phosphopantetheinyl transferase
VSPLEPEAVHVWSAALDDDGRVETCRQVLSDSERNRAQCFRFEHLRRRYVIAHGFLREVLGGYLGLAPAAVRFETGEHGKPFVSGAEVQFNLSHSGDLAVCAVTQARNVGVDVELIRPVHYLDAIVGRFFAAGEREKIGAALDRGRAFFECWTRKEAYIKGVGGGFSIPLTSFDTSLPVPGWTFESLPPFGNSVGAVAVEGPIHPLQVFRWAASAGHRA